MKVNTRLKKLENLKFLTENVKQGRGFMGFLFHTISLMLPLFAQQYNYYFCTQCTQDLDVFDLCCERKQVLIHSSALQTLNPLTLKCSVKYLVSIIQFGIHAPILILFMM